MQDHTTVSSNHVFERLRRSLSESSAAATVAVGFALTLAAGVLDYATGPQLASLTFYLVPIALVAWAGARWQGVGAALAGALLWAVAEALRGRDYESAGVFVWSSLTRFVVLLTIALLVHRVRRPRTVATATGAACPHCGSTNTVELNLGLVCQSCKRLS